MHGMNVGGGNSQLFLAHTVWSVPCPFKCNISSIMDKRVKTDSNWGRWNNQEHMQQRDCIRLYYLVKNLSQK